MTPGEEFIRRQDDELKQLERIFREKAIALVKVWQNNAPREEQVESLLELHRAGTEYFRRLDAEVFNRECLKGAEYERWKGEWMVTTAKNLNELPRYHRNLREKRDHLGLRESMFEPPNGAYRNIQSFFAATSKEQVPALRTMLNESKIPTDGLNKPYLPKPHFDMGVLRPFISVGVVVVLVAAFVIAAQYVHPIVLGGILSVVVVILVFISATELLREGKLKEKSFFEIAKLAIAKRFQFVIGQSGSKDEGITRKKKP